MEKIQGIKETEYSIPGIFDMLYTAIEQGMNNHRTAIEHLKASAEDTGIEVDKKHIQSIYLLDSIRNEMKGCMTKAQQYHNLQKD